MPKFTRSEVRLPAIRPADVGGQHLSRLSSDFPKNPVRCLSAVHIFCQVPVCSDFLRKCVRNSRKKQSVVCLSGRIRTRQSCPDFHCPCPPTSDVAHIINTSTTVNNSVLHKQLRYSQRIKSIAILMVE